MGIQFIKKKMKKNTILNHAFFKKNTNINNQNLLMKIKSKYILKQIFDNLEYDIFLKIIKYNQNMQERLEININHYRDFCEIEIEITPIDSIDKHIYKYINIPEKDRPYFQIYFDDREKINNYYLNSKDEVSKIRIKIDHHIKSFYKLFSECNGIESLSFLKFSRNNIINMNGMFEFCSSLKKINLSIFNTNKVKDMGYMFSGCSSLRELNLSNFKTNNVINMCGMFSGCTKLKKLNLSNFNTNKVTNMNGMFLECLSLKELNISNFNTINVKRMYRMFYNCSFLKELDISNFNITNDTDIKGMFGKCSNELKIKIRKQNNNLRNEAY